MNKNIVAVAVVGLIAVALVVAAVLFLTGGDKSKNAANKNAPKALPTSTTGNRHEAVSDITVEITDANYSPQTVVAVLNKKLTIAVKNTGTKPHNLTVQGLTAATKTLQPGESETLSFTPDKAGMYMFQSIIDSKPEEKLNGMLMIQPAAGN